MLFPGLLRYIKRLMVAAVFSTVASKVVATIAVTGRSTGTTVYLDVSISGFKPTHDGASGNWSSLTGVGWSFNSGPNYWWNESKWSVSGPTTWSGTLQDPAQYAGAHTYTINAYCSSWDYYDNGWVDNGDGTGYEDDGFNENDWNLWESTTVTVMTAMPQTIVFPTIPNQPSTNRSPIPLTATASSGLPISYSVDGPATVSGNALMLTGEAGAVTVVASVGGNSAWLAGSMAQTFFVGQSQSISFPAIADRGFTSAPFSVSASASSGLGVVFLIGNGPAIIIANKVKLTGAGAVTIIATQPGDENWGAAPNVTRTFNVSPAAQTISFSPIDDHSLTDAPFSVSAAASSGLPVALSVVSGPATISGAAVTLTGSGVVTIAAAQSGGFGYAPAPIASQSFTVNPAPAALTTTSFTNPGGTNWTVPAGVQSVSVLVVGGGGGGGQGQESNGGGGGGGVLSYSAVPVTPGQNVVVNVGSGGVAGGGGGGYSAFGSLGADGGGGATASGGSGGGGSGSVPGAVGVAGQGSAGGNGQAVDPSGWSEGGGGGGAESSGEDAQEGLGGRGGPGRVFHAMVVAAGGDGGSNYADDTTSPLDGMSGGAGTGNGGGGADDSYTVAGSGGTGIVTIVAPRITTGYDLIWITTPASSLPAAATIGQTISFTVQVQNNGTLPWDGAIEVTDVTDSSNVISVGRSSIAGATSGAITTATFQITIPNSVGSHQYQFTPRAADNTAFGTIETAAVVAGRHINLSSLAFSAATPPTIYAYTDDVTALKSQYASYRLRAKFIDSYTGYDFHAAVYYNNNNEPLDYLPPPAPNPVPASWTGYWQVTLYWLGYNSAGDVVAMGPPQDVAVKIDLPKRPDGTDDPSYANRYVILPGAVDHGAATDINFNSFLGNVTDARTFELLIPPGVTLTSDGKAPAFSTGAMPAGSRVLVVNQGVIKSSTTFDAFDILVPTTLDVSYSTASAQALVSSTGGANAITVTDSAGSLQLIGPSGNVVGNIVTNTTLPPTTPIPPAVPTDIGLNIHLP